MSIRNCIAKRNPSVYSIGYFCFYTDDSITQIMSRHRKSTNNDDMKCLVFIWKVILIYVLQKKKHRVF